MKSNNSWCFSTSQHSQAQPWKDAEESDSQNPLNKYTKHQTTKQRSVLELSLALLDRFWFLTIPAKRKLFQGS